MTLEEIRSVRNAEPFRAFSLRLHGGRHFRIDAQHDLGISPKGILLAVSSNRGTAFLAPDQVKQILQHPVPARN